MINPKHRTAEPVLLTTDDDALNLEQLFKLLRDNPHLSATQLIEMLSRKQERDCTSLLHCIT